MIIMHRLIVDSGVVYYVIDKSDAALLCSIGEVELVKHFELVSGLLLCLCTGCE